MWLTLFRPIGAGVGVALAVLLEVPCAVGVAVGVAPVPVGVGVGRGTFLCLIIEEPEPLLHPTKARRKARTAIRPRTRREVLVRVI